MAKDTLWNVIERTLEKAGVPLTAKEIWDKSEELNTRGEFVTSGKTPWATVSAYCYMEMDKGGDNSSFVKVSENPAYYTLRRLQIGKPKFVIPQKNATKNNGSSVKERSLHPILVTYAEVDSHFKAMLKTIYHEKSNKAAKGKNEWLHPDLVGVYFPFGGYTREVLEMQNQLSTTSVKLFSFELKVELNFSNLRASYFQAVSNSSWANEGYLVALNIDEDSAFQDEIRRLNNAFGIGVIQLKPQIFESEILFPSRINPEIDWDTVNRLAKENSDFSDFIKSVSESCKVNEVVGNYDKTLETDEIDSYLEKHDIK